MKTQDVKIMTVASGKGGVGKTNIALNLALSLAKQERRVCLLDADFGLSNVDILLGISPEKSLMDFLDSDCSLDEIIVDGPDSLQIVPGGSALESLPDLSENKKERLGEVLKHFNGYDDLIIDSAAGISDQVLYFLGASGTPIIVLVPEPTSLTDAYALIKTYQNKGNTVPVSIVINQVKSAKHAAMIFNKFNNVIKKHLDIEIRLLGYLPKDSRVNTSVASQKPFVQLFPESPVSRAIKRIGEVLLSSNGNKGTLDTLFFQPDFSSKSFDAPDRKNPETDNTNHGDNPEPNIEKIEYTGEIINLLAKEGYVTPAQIQYAQKVREKLDTPRSLLDTLKELSNVREDQIRDALYKNRTGIRLGSLLVELGYISEKQLSMTLNQQKHDDNNKRLGEMLVENNYITAYELTQVLSISLGIEYIEPDLSSIDTTLMEKASKRYFHMHLFLPLKTQDGSVHIVMSDPLNAESIDFIKHLYGPDFLCSITMEKYILEIIEAYDASKSQQNRIQADENEVVKIVNDLIADALKKNASDIHIEPLKNRLRVRFRTDGSLIHHKDLSKNLEPAIVSRLKVMASANIAERRRHQDGRIVMASTGSDESVDIRVSFYATLFGEKVVLRILTKKAELYKVEDLGMGSKMSERFREDVLELPSGVVIITGPTGAGKTTTLYASINYCNQIDTNIITAEEPVEYVIEGIAQCSIDTRIGLTFEETLRHMLRQDPDIIILGEIRDKFSAESCIQAALTGHKVLTTFHTEDSIGGLLRLMNMDIETFLISSTVVCVVAQRLLKKICPHCNKPYVPTAKDLRRLNYQSKDVSGYNFQIGEGCAHCDFTGYRGRVGVFEMLVLNEYVKEAILQRKTSYEIRRTSIDSTGLVTLLEDGLGKAAKGLTSLPEVIRHLPLLEAPRPLEQIYRLNGEIS